MHKDFLTNHDILHHDILGIKVQSTYLFLVNDKISIVRHQIVTRFDFLDTKIYFYYLKILSITS